MSTTFVQKQSPAQKKDAPSASSVLDASSQSESLQRKAELANGAVQRVEPPRPNNTGMPDNLKAGIESLSGFSMDDVRVHYNSSKPATVQALAYTQGTDIHVAPGQEKHLPHEAWHVAQQMAGRVSPTTNINGMPVNDNAALEHEADVMGEMAVQCKSDRKITVPKVLQCIREIIQCGRGNSNVGGSGKGPGKDLGKGSGKGPGKGSGKDLGKGPGKGSDKDLSKGPGKGSGKDLSKGPGRDSGVDSEISLGDVSKTRETSIENEITEIVKSGFFASLLKMKDALEYILEKTYSMCHNGTSYSEKKCGKYKKMICFLLEKYMRIPNFILFNFSDLIHQLAQDFVLLDYKGGRYHSLVGEKNVFADFYFSQNLAPGQSVTFNKVDEKKRSALNRKPLVIYRNFDLSAIKKAVPLDKKDYSGSPIDLFGGAHGGALGTALFYVDQRHFSNKHDVAVARVTINNVDLGGFSIKNSQEGEDAKTERSSVLPLKCDSWAGNSYPQFSLHCGPGKLAESYEKGGHFEIIYSNVLFSTYVIRDVHKVEYTIGPGENKWSRSSEKVDEDSADENPVVDGFEIVDMGSDENNCLLLSMEIGEFSLGIRDDVKIFETELVRDGALPECEKTEEGGMLTPQTVFPVLNKIGYEKVVWIYVLGAKVPWQCWRSMSRQPDSYHSELPPGEKENPQNVFLFYNGVNHYKKMNPQ